MSESVWKFMRENEIKISCEVSKELQCKICNKLMIKACQAPCGCRFCSDCIQHYLDGNDKFCPGTSRYCQNRKINYANDIAIDRPFNIRISEIVVNCPRQNCEFNDELQMIENHMRTCDKQPISCPFNAIGCEMNEIRNEEMKSHLNEEIYSHSKLLIELINNLRNEMESMKSENIELKRKFSQSKQQNENIELQLRNQQQKMCEMEAKEQENTGEIEEINEKMAAVNNANRALQNEIIKLSRENSQFKQQIKNIEKQIETIKTKTQQQINAFKPNFEQRRENKKNEMEKCANEIRPIQTKFGNAEFKNLGFVEWNHDKLSQLERYKWIYSKPFHSGPGGYKMCLGVYINNNGGICVGFFLMRGNSDNKLEWPFKYTVTVDAIDPGDGNVYDSHTVKYSYSPADARWGKPSTDKNDPIIYYDYYINLISVKNDKLLLKCRIKKL